MKNVTNTWWKNAVFYHIYPKSFYDSNNDGLGDLRGIIKKLPYLKDLGINAIWMGPFFKSPQVDSGYDISDYREIDPRLGNLEDLENLIEEAHTLGIKVLLDLVFNHTSDQHPWFIESKKNNPEYRDYYIWRDKKSDGTLPNQWQGSFGGDAWSFDKQRDQYYLHLFAKEQPDLNWTNPKVRQELSQIANYWINKGVDGFRMDVINFIAKDMTKEAGFIDGPHILEYFQEFRASLQNKENIVLVGECPGVSPEAAKAYTDPANKALDMILVFDHVSVDGGPNGKWDYQGWTPLKLMDILQKWQDITKEPRWATLYMSNHDQPRVLSRFGSELFPFLSASALASLFFLQRGTPIIYQGDEIGMTNTKLSSLENLQDVESINAYHMMKNSWKLSEGECMDRIQKIARDNGRTPMQWSTDHQGGFTEAEKPWYPLNPNYKSINVESQINDRRSILSYYKKLIDLCKRDLFSHGEFIPLLKSSCIAYLRVWKKENALILINLDSQPVKVPPKDEIEALLKKRLTTLLGNTHRKSPLIDKEGLLNLGPYECQILKIED